MFDDSILEQLTIGSFSILFKNRQAAARPRPLWRSHFCQLCTVRRTELTKNSAMIVEVRWFLGDFTGVKYIFKFFLLHRMEPTSTFRSTATWSFCRLCWKENKYIIRYQWLGILPQSKVINSSAFGYIRLTNMNTEIE
jgi:hypothetical protein